MRCSSCTMMIIVLTLFGQFNLKAQYNADTSVLNYEEVRTYVNPVLPGDHPDPTLLKVGDDFYHCGSSFHFTPYLPVYHSRDLVHWKIIGRVVTPTAGSFVTDRPSGGIWQGAITYFYGSYWIYFSANGQWFCKADFPAGPWSTPVEVKTNAVTGPLGYDNSIFVDDDGKPYMVIKNGQKINRIQALGKDGQLTDTVINLDWINARLQYSWAEGPVMCKRNGYYYYFPAGDVSGGQYVLRASALTADSTKWERLGNFFKPITDSNNRFKSPNHISAPVELADGTWWTIGQSYERTGNDDWSGMGRQTSLYQVIWEGDRPWGVAPVSTPLQKPQLPKSDISWRSAQSDYFKSDSLGLWWHFLNKGSAAQYSLTTRKGWVRLSPGKNRVHLVQKETDHFYTVITKVDFDAKDTAAKAGIYLTNGNQKVFVRFYSGYDKGKRIALKFDTAYRSVENTKGNIVWLKVERNEHQLTGYFSGDGISWQAVGAPVNVSNLDKVQPDFNSWVGTSVGVFAEGMQADFNCYIYKDAFSSLKAAGYRNYYGVQTEKTKEKAVINNSLSGGWFMLSGVDFGNDESTVSGVALNASALASGKVEIWLDDLKTGRQVAVVDVSSTGINKNYKAFRKALNGITGLHDVFVKFTAGSKNAVYVESLRFERKSQRSSIAKSAD